MEFSYNTNYLKAFTVDWGIKDAHDTRWRKSEEKNLKRLSTDPYESICI